MEEIMSVMSAGLPRNVESPKKRGRPRLFDHQKALEEAMKLFWERGYEGTSLSDLSAAMHVGPSTFYKLFGNKERLFEKTVRHYLLGAGGRQLKNILLGRHDTQTTFRHLLEAAASECTNPNLPAGCMLSLAGTHLAPEHQSIRNMMIGLRSNFERKLEDRLRMGVQLGELAPDTNTSDLASYFGAVICGIAVQARDGKSLQHLLQLAKLAMQAWPKDLYMHSATT